LKRLIQHLAVCTIVHLRTMHRFMVVNVVGMMTRHKIRKDAIR